MAQKAAACLITIDSLANSLTLFAFIVAAPENALEIEMAGPIMVGFVGEYRQADNKETVLVLLTHSYTVSYLWLPASSGEVHY